jgi:hypothetical protein
MELLAKVHDLESEKQALSDNVTSLQDMLSTMQHQFGGLDQSFGSQSRWQASPDENQDP